MLQYNFSIITITNRKNYFNTIINNFLRQELNNKELIIVINNDEINLLDYANDTQLYKNIKIYKLSQDISLGSCLNFAIENCNNNIIAKFDDDDYYGKYYLSEIKNTFSNVECDIVGKSKTFTYFEKYHELRLKKYGVSNNYTNKVLGSTLCFKKSIYSQIKFRDVNISEDKYFNMNCINYGYKIFSTSHYNHIILKHKNNKEHTFKSNINFLIDTSSLIKDNISYNDCFSIVDKIY